MSRTIRHRVACSLLSLLSLTAAVWSSAVALAQPTAAVSDKPVDASDLILGEWWTEGKQGRVRITREKEGTFRGTTTCCVHENDPDNPKLDTKNPNPAQRSRSTVGIVIIWKLAYEDGEYVDGYVYNPRDGKTYRIEAKVIDHDTLKIRGYMGISLLGQNQIWKRAQPSAAGAAKPADRARGVKP
ncbi:MAG: DUF2147 domain-containing protein [Polyangiales bacterium]